MNKLCFECHDPRKLGMDEQARGHVITGHPTIGGKDILYPKRDYTCASCHNPHSSNQEKLFRYNYSVAPYDGNKCSVCHYRHAIGYKPPTPPWTE